MPQATDPLADIVALLRPSAVFSKAITGRGRWGVRYDAQAAPSFCIIVSGHCWLTLSGRAPKLLQVGDFLLLPITPAFTLASAQNVECVPGRPSRSGLRHGDPKGHPTFRMIGGAFEINPGSSDLLELMSQPIHIRANECDTSRLSRILGLILEEYSGYRPGREIMLQHFLEAMLVEALRWPNPEASSLSPGLGAALRDASISQALRAMHSDIRHTWTVAELAKRAAMSRSAFAAQFVAMVGCAPMEYLARWRMSIAQDALNHGVKSLEQLAFQIGYQSASAFSTAFRRRLGCAPGAYARAVR